MTYNTTDNEGIVFSQDRHYRRVELPQERKDLLHRLFLGKRNKTLSDKEEDELVHQLNKEEFDIYLFGDEQDGEYYILNAQEYEDDYMEDWELELEIKTPSDESDISSISDVESDTRSIDGLSDRLLSMANGSDTKTKRNSYTPLVLPFEDCLKRMFKTNPNDDDDYRIVYDDYRIVCRNLVNQLTEDDFEILIRYSDQLIQVNNKFFICNMDPELIKHYIRVDDRYERYKEYFDILEHEDRIKESSCKYKYPDYIRKLSPKWQFFLFEQIDRKKHFMSMPLCLNPHYTKVNPDKVLKGQYTVKENAYVYVPDRITFCKYHYKKKRLPDIVELQLEPVKSNIESLLKKIMIKSKQLCNDLSHLRTNYIPFKDKLSKDLISRELKDLIKLDYDTQIYLATELSHMLFIDGRLNICKNVPNIIDFRYEIAPYDYIRTFRELERHHNVEYIGSHIVRLILHVLEISDPYLNLNYKRVSLGLSELQILNMIKYKEKNKDFITKEDIHGLSDLGKRVLWFGKYDDQDWFAPKKEEKDITKLLACYDEIPLL